MIWLVPTRESDNDPVETSTTAWEALYRAQVTVMRKLQRQEEFADLSMREYDVLFNLARSDAVSYTHLTLPTKA